MKKKKKKKEKKKKSSYHSFFLEIEERKGQSIIIGYLHFTGSHFGFGFGFGFGDKLELDYSRGVNPDSLLSLD